MKGRDLTVQGQEIVASHRLKPGERKVMIRLDGLALTDQGRLTRADLFRFLHVDTQDYSDLAFTAEEAETIAQHLRFLRTGLNAVVPIYCGGEARCPFARDCPFVKVGKVPLGRVCPVEADLMRVWTEAYLEEFQVDPSNISELSLVQELAELDIYDRRATFHLRSGEGQGLLQNQVVGTDTQGRPLVQSQIHQAWALKERIRARKMKILEALVGTRKEKYKAAAAKQQDNIDPSTLLVRLKERLDTIRLVKPENDD